MDLNQIIACAATAYPDELILAYWDKDARQPVDNPDAGDTLALFIVREIKDTFDPAATDVQQVETVIDALTRASNEIERVASVMQYLTLLPLRRRQQRLSSRHNKPQRKEAAHACRGD